MRRRKLADQNSYTVANSTYDPDQRYVRGTKCDVFRCLLYIFKQMTPYFSLMIYSLILRNCL